MKPALYSALKTCFRSDILPLFTFACTCSSQRSILKTNMYWSTRRLAVTAGSDDYFHTTQFSSGNSDCCWRDCGSGRVDHWWHLSCNYTIFIITEYLNKDKMPNLGQGTLNLEKQFVFYASYHHNPVNVIIHLFCIWPLLATFILLLQVIILSSKLFVGFYWFLTITFVVNFASCL